MLIKLFKYLFSNFYTASSPICAIRTPFLYFKVKRITISLEIKNLHEKSILIYISQIKLLDHKNTKKGIATILGA